ncbi:AbfB domain-containing protein, partial [Streptomyces luteogriseus]|uniref:AbfB domain-containing protein n=1 Tax=Streptomyces luteogriseus TaxID=68233 RepID=UPI00260928C9
VQCVRVPMGCRRGRGRRRPGGGRVREGRHDVDGGRGATGQHQCGGRGLRSHNNPTRYIRHADYALRIDPVTTTTERQDATFRVGY